MIRVLIRYDRAGLRALSDAVQACKAEFENLGRRPHSPLWSEWIYDPPSQKCYEIAVWAVGEQARRLGLCLWSGKIEIEARARSGAQRGLLDAQVARVLWDLRALLVAHLGVVCDPERCLVDPELNDLDWNICNHRLAFNFWTRNGRDCDPLSEAVVKDFSATARELAKLVEAVPEAPPIPVEPAGPDQAQASSIAALAANGSTPEAASEVADLVTLDQAASMVHRDKRTLERYKTKGELPEPEVEGGGGKPHLYDWRKLRPWLEQKFGIRQPETFPANRRS